ncbi:MAG: hypothetical protein K2W95_09890 [Candidatus Obscuribacterales bacterium]|nr:hypothetical protein [Candidatus Obscuribacterales bacterium]
MDSSIILEQSGTKAPPSFTPLVTKARLLALDSRFDGTRESSEIKLITIEINCRESGKLLKAARSILTNSEI